MAKSSGVPQHQNLRWDKPAGNYLLVGCQGVRVLTALYVGQSNDVLRRALEHRTVYEDQSIPADKDGRLVYHHLKGCDEVFHFRLAEQEVEDKKVRTVVEGLWCLFLGTFQYNQAWMALRRKFGLLNVGEQVRGGNGKWQVEVDLGRIFAYSGSP